MREKKAFAQRKHKGGIQSVKKKYFLVFEGEKTEEQYFEAVEVKRQYLGISPLIELCPIVRSHSEVGWSNPKKIVDKLIAILEGDITYEDLINRLLEVLKEEEDTAESGGERRIFSNLKNCVEREFVKELSDKVADISVATHKMLENIKGKGKVDDIFNELFEKIKDQDITYYKEIDEVCLIIDRDKKSFFSHEGNNQYDYVIDICKEKEFKLFITNPCFEFWILIHYEKKDNLDLEKLLENEKVSSKVTYAEEEVRKVFEGYKKANYDAEKLVEKLDIAIENAAEFCSDLEELENKVGTNLHELFIEMQTVK